MAIPTVRELADAYNEVGKLLKDRSKYNAEELFKIMTKPDFSHELQYAKRACGIELVETRVLNSQPKIFWELGKEFFDQLGYSAFLEASN